MRIVFSSSLGCHSLRLVSKQLTLLCLHIHVEQFLLFDKAFADSVQVSEQKSAVDMLIHKQ